MQLDDIRPLFMVRLLLRLMIIDLHFHTCVPGRLQARSLLDYDRRNALVYNARFRGLDAICLTEHDKLWEKDAIRVLTEEHGLLVLRGMEVTTNYADFGHVLVYGLDKYMPGIHDINKLARVVEQEGAVMFLAHPFREVYSWSGEAWVLTLTVEEACRLPALGLAHGIEVFNGETLRHANEFAVQVGRASGLYGTGGSDAHYSTGVGNCATVFQHPIRDEADLLAELRAGRFQAVIRKDGAFMPAYSV